MKQTEFKNVQLKDIAIGEFNHRKAFDETSMQELTDSIREKGVLQPVVLRYMKKEGKYELVCGERRFRASKAAGLTEIPATIRELTDEEVVELQIIENLQRKDVHPMEEGAAFKQLLDAKGWTVNEIGSRVGKPANYVARRLRLTEIVPDFQKAFFENRIGLTDMERLFKLSTADQKALWQEECEGRSGKLSITDGDIRSYLGDLNDAPFDTTDETLDKKAGACTSCPHNSGSNALLFPDTSKAQCGNSSCYHNKCKLAFAVELKKACEDPEVELVSSDWNLSKDGQALVNKGHKVYDRSDYDTVRKPEAPELEDYEEWLEDGDYDSREEMMEAYEKARADYGKELAEYNKKIESGKYIKAFIVEGNRKGCYTYIKITSKGGGGAATSAATKEKAKEGTITVDDINSEIERIKSNESRKKELDEEKISPLVYDVLTKHKNFLGNTKELTTSEQIAAILALGSSLEYSLRKHEEVLYKSVGYKSGSAKLAEYNALAALSPQKREQLINGLLRILFYGKLHNAIANSTEDDQAAALEAVATSYDASAVKTIRAAQMEERAKREARVAERLKKLAEQKKELLKATVKQPPVKKATKAKA